jgi:pyruvate-formate lyase
LAGDREAETFLDAAVETIDAVLELARRYAAVARAAGRDDLAEVLQRAPAHPAASFHQALQALRLCHAVLWLSGHYHCGLGRLDQYLWPYLEADLAEGRLVRGGSPGTAGGVLHQPEQGQRPLSRASSRATTANR